MPQNYLFICSRNKWRSRTAEDIFQHLDEINVRSAGTAQSARIKVNEKLINWADLIFVMEKEHKRRLTERFSQLLHDKEIIVLGIPDEYQYMDQELIDILKATMQPFVA